MKTKLLSLLTLAILINIGVSPLLAKSSPETKVNYNSYFNFQYDYLVKYPDFLIPQGEADNQDGQKFISQDKNNQFWVYFSNKIDLETDELLSIDMAFNEDLEGKDVITKELHEDHYVISGKLPDNRLFTQYTISDMGSYFTMWFEYRESDKELFNEIIEYVTASFVVGVNEGRNFTEIDEDFKIFLATFLDECWWGKNFNSLLRDNDKKLAKYIDPKMDIRRYYAPGAVAYLASRADNFGFNEYDDFKTKVKKPKNYSILVLTNELLVCELDKVSEVYCNSVLYVPEELVNSETFEFAPVQLPYPDAAIICVYLVQNKNSSPLGLYFINTPNGWKLAFVNSSFCSA